MQQHIIKLPAELKQKKLHIQLGSFVRTMQRRQDAAELQKDKLKAVPVTMLRAPIKLTT